MPMLSTPFASHVINSCPAALVPRDRWAGQVIITASLRSRWWGGMLTDYDKRNDCLWGERGPSSSYKLLCQNFGWQYVQLTSATSETSSEVIAHPEISQLPTRAPMPSCRAEVWKWFGPVARTKHKCFGLYRSRFRFLTQRIIWGPDPNVSGSTFRPKTGTYISAITSAIQRGNYRNFPFFRCYINFVCSWTYEN